MSISNHPWGGLDDRSYFFPLVESLDASHKILVSFGNATISPHFQWIFSISYEGNLDSISTTILINISTKPGVMENILIRDYFTPDEINTYTSLFKELCDSFAWSYDEMTNIDPQIFQHKIKTYLGAKPIRMKLQLISPRKVASIKAKFQKILDVGFIYLVPLTEWVSNHVPVDKKQGTILVCVYYYDLNLACPKENYPTPFIDQMLNACDGNVIFYG